MSGEHGHEDITQNVTDLAKAVSDLATVATTLSEEVASQGARITALENQTPPDPWTPAFPGQPPPGMFIIGATTKHHGTIPPNEPADKPIVDPFVKYEQPTGVALSTYRSYATPSQWASDSGLRAIITRDVQAGRIPMPSWKPPANRTWAQIASGAEDQVIDSKLLFLKSFAPWPIHAIFNHECDATSNDSKGSPADYIAMIAHIRERMVALGVTNVSLHLNLVGYGFARGARSTLGHPRHMDNWWDADVFDFASVDPYGDGLHDRYFKPIEDWMAEKDIPWMVVEWGYKAGSKYGDTHSWTKDEVLAFHQRLRDNPLCFGAQVWDSDQNGDPYLVTPGQLEAIRELMKRPDTYRVEVT